jgi:hypothetical protein
MHEWETNNLKENCDWCKAPIGKVLEERTPLERMFDKKSYQEWLDEWSKEK